MFVTLIAAVVSLRNVNNVSHRTNILHSTKTETRVKESWDFWRFVQTANYYDALKPKFLKDWFRKEAKPVLVKPGSAIWSISGDNIYETSWGPLDDVVMGGNSSFSNLVRCQHFQL